MKRSRESFEKNRMGENAKREFFKACYEGDLDVVKKCLSRGWVNVEAKDNARGRSGIHWAALTGHADVVKVLLESGANANAVDKGKDTALHLAAGHGHVDVAKVLIQNGAKVNAVNFRGRTALHVAAKYEHADYVKLLIQNGADLNAVEEGKMTPLHFAALEGHADVAKVLLQNGADVNAVQSCEWTALHLAAMRKNTHSVLQLLCFGAEINEKAINEDLTTLLGPINDRLRTLREGNGMETTLMSDEEKRFMWNLAFSFTITHRVAAFKAYYAIRSYITFHGIFMGPGYDRGKRSLWRL